MGTLSAIIITKNEAIDLPDCLASLGFASEVLVVDSGSSDSTQEQAVSAGAKFVKFNDWAGFGVQKQRALDLSSSDWVLSIDADERVSPLLANSIMEVVESGLGGSISGFEIHRHNYFLGKRLRFGGWGNDFVVRLAKRTLCQFDLAPIHERLLVEGPVGRLRGPLVHLSYASKRELLDKREVYAVAGARKLLKAGKSCSGSLEAFIRACWSFFKHCILQVGFLDGPIGVYAAYCKASESFRKYWLLARMNSLE